MTHLSTEELQRRFERAMEGLSDFYDVNDIKARVASGQMMSWQEGQSVVVTEVLGFPKGLALNVVLAVGNLEEIMALQERVSAWGAAQGCCKIMMRGRKGWSRVLPKYGWTNGQAVYELDLTEGERI